LGLVYKNVMFVENAGADLWVIPGAAETLAPGQPLSDAIVMQARVTPGVAVADPLLYSGASIQLPGGGSEAVTLIGTRAPAFLGGPWNFVLGDRSALAQPDTLLFEDSDRDKLGGLNIGSVRELNGHRIVVGGFTWGLVPFGPSYAFADYELAQRLLHFDRDRMSYVLVKVAPGVDVDSVQAALQQRVPETKVVKAVELRWMIVKYLLTRTQIGVSFGTSTVFGLLIGLIIVALSMFSSVIDNLREFGTLKAIGATTVDLAKLLFVQSVTYAVLGSLVGSFLVTRIAGGIRSAQLSMFVPFSMMATTWSVMILMCIAASTLALMRIRKVEPGMVFR
jgi:putative ABC transport system permease protein